MKQYLSVGLIVVALSLLGCGGGGGSDNSGGTTPPSGNGRAVLAIDWPSRDRAIPYTANSLDITLSHGAKTVAHKVVNRPAGVEAHSDLTFTNLPVGTLQASIKALPETSAVGTPQAVGTATFQTFAGQDSTIPVSLKSTVTSLSIAASNQPSVGNSTQLTVSALDASGRTVLLRYGGYQEAISWSSSAPSSVATIQADGATAVLESLAEGSTTITASFAADDGATQVSTQKVLTVQSASGTVVIR